MSKTIFAVVAISAAAGSAATATLYKLRPEKKETASAATMTTKLANGGAPNSSSPVPVPASQIFAQTATPTMPGTATGVATSAILRCSPVDPAGLFAHGFPGPVNDLASRQALISSFDRRLRNPHWVVEHITPASLAVREGDRKNSSFLEDDSVPEKFRARLEDYYRSGYDRGHQVPAADCKWAQTAMDETFYLSNICPQVGEGFNRDYWAYLEDFCRRLTTKYPSVRIATGPLYLPKRDPKDNKWYVKYEVIGNPPSVAVPTHFFKVIFGEDGIAGGKVALGAFVLPNASIPNDKPLADFEVPVEAVERASGLEFASKLPVHRRKRLCTEISCAIIVREYAGSQNVFGTNKGGSRRPSSGGK